jgi:hypothetical protein
MAKQATYMAFDICRGVLELVYTGSPKLVPAAT